MKRNNPIGIFDSGIGGLTVANAISNLLPNEDIVYFGDTKHMPYGEKSKTSIELYSKKITDYLVTKHQCKVIVIACNTASAIAYEALKTKYLGTIPIINVIDPMIEYILDKKFLNVGIIGTRAMIESGVYQEKLIRRSPNQKFSALATPLLASMIEESFIDNQISTLVIKKYLTNEVLKNIDSLVLGCTHYPLIEKEIKNILENKVEILNSAFVVSQKLKSILDKENLTSLAKTHSKKFFVSDITNNFMMSTKLFYGSNVELYKVDL